MSRVVFIEDNMSGFPVPKPGFKTLGMNGAVLSTLDSTGDIQPVCGCVGGGVPDTQFYVVDAINGDDSTGVKGSYNTPFATIKGAELVASSGESIKIITDVQEANRGKNGLTYIFDKGCHMSYPSTEPSITGLNWNSLWTDQSGTDISYTVIGGRFTIDSYWYGVWKKVCC